MAKLKLEFDGFEEVIARLNKLDGDVKNVTAEALKASRDYVNPQLHDAMGSHRRTGKTEGSIVEKSKVEWAGNVGKIDVGFDLEHGGLPSIFLMYGTKAHMVRWYGTPRRHPGTSPDKKLYNAIFGGATQKQIRQIQEDIFYAEIRKLNG